MIPVYAWSELGGSSVGGGRTARRKTLGHRVFGARRIGLVGLIALSRSQLRGGRIFGRVAVGRKEFWRGHRWVRSI